ncbi:hypothetical protein [Arthrobacter sp. SO3]|uniref:hypothetical protein n=1 Tax=Arthrobacter sp. SO3 TaxID=1897057 RepID=UPI001CFF8FF9|nr:hypothetical protein [Arthrobacter sp. SO3]MCB5291710.1 hypothetical protein [Arthrobacter sp. SO3]
MRDPFMVLLGGLIVFTAIAAWIALNRPGRQGPKPQRETTPVRRVGVRRRWELAGCIVLAAAGLDVAAAYGIGTSSPGGSGITVELGFSMMVLAVAWSIFRQEILRYQLRLGAALYGLPTPAEPAQVKAAEYTGVILRLLLFLLGLITALARLIFR